MAAYAYLLPLASTAGTISNLNIFFAHGPNILYSIQYGFFEHSPSILIAIYGDQQNPCDGYASARLNSNATKTINRIFT
eukprot:SAG22_NODE_3745_length_1547_cov_1.695442_1_plen_79_part_00